MKIRELMESKPEGKMTAHHKNVSNGGETRMRDVGGYDRTYHLNRIWMATAMADGKSAKPVDMDSASWVEKYNVAVPYTDEEHLMVLAAMATIPTDGQELNKRARSKEDNDVGTTSPVSNWNKNVTKKKSKKD